MSDTLNNRNRGFTLIELMVALVLGLVVIGGVMGVFISTYQANAQNIKAVRLNEEMRAVMSMMTRDIRRAGTRDLAWQPSLLGSDNPFANDVNWVVSRYSASYPQYSCVLFAYDRDSDDALTNTDRFGYRLKDGRVEYRDGSGTDCQGGSWAGLSDEKTARVLSLSFTATISPPDYTPNSPPAIEDPTGVGLSISVLPVTITLRAATNTRASDPTKNAAGSALTPADCNNIDVVCRTLVEKIRLRNDAIL